MSGGDIDLSEMNEDQMELLLRRIEERKRMKRGRTPDPPALSDPKGANSLPPEPADYREEQTNYRQEPTQYKQEPTQYRQEPIQYRQEQTNYRQETTNYRQEQTSHRQHSAGYRQEPNYRQEQPNYRDPNYRQEPNIRQNYRQEQPTYRQDRQEPNYRQEQPNYRQERTAYRQDPASDRTPHRSQYPPESAYSAQTVYAGLTADSDSDDLASLESFISSNLSPDLPDEEWYTQPVYGRTSLFVSPASRPSEQQRRVRVADWLRKGSEDEFEGTQEYKPRRTEYHRSPSPSAPLPRYKSPIQPQPPSPLGQPPSPLGQPPSPLGQLPDILAVSAPSRYTEQMERRNYTEFQSPRPAGSSPYDPALRGSPDWSREGAGSPSRGPDQTRFSPQVHLGY